MHGTRVNERELSQGEECEIFSGDALQFGSPVIRGNGTLRSPQLPLPQSS